MLIQYCEACKRRIMTHEDGESEQGVLAGEHWYCVECAKARGIEQSATEEARDVISARRRVRQMAPAARSQAAVYVFAGAALIGLAVVFFYRLSRGTSRDTGPAPDVQGQQMVFHRDAPQAVRLPDVPRPPGEKREAVTEPAAKTTKASGWKMLFNGRDLAGWTVAGRANVENGAIVLSPETDLFYFAQWTGFELEIEISVERVEPNVLHLFTVSLFHSAAGRGEGRVRMHFYPDGDIHAMGGDRQLLRKFGEGTLFVEGQTRLRFEASKDTVRVFHGDIQKGSVGISQVPEKAGGFMIYSHKGSKVSIKSVRARTLD